MTLCNRLALAVRIVFVCAMWVAAGCISGCGYDHVGPDPLPWTQPADPNPQR
jgi:hypothetical protein